MMLSYNSDPNLKKMMVSEMEAHEKADAIVQGMYGETKDGKWRGYTVSCAIRSLNLKFGKNLSTSDHEVYETELGIPKWLAKLEDSIFEGLPVEKSKSWPKRFLSAVPVGKDLQPLKWKFCAFILKENIERVLTLDIPKELKKQVVDSVRGVLNLHEQLFLRRLWDFEQANQVMTFDSMMFNAMNADLFPGSVQYVFIDEAQDNGRAQNAYWQRVLDKNSQIRGFMLVGDDKQAINRFKGGDAESFLGFTAEMNVSLAESFRCPAPILEIANRIASPIKNRSPLISTSKAKSFGSVTFPHRFSQTFDALHQAVALNQDVLILARQGYTVKNIIAKIIGHSIPIYSEVSDRIRRLSRAFIDMERSRVITRQDLEAVYPARRSNHKPQKGEVKVTCKYIDQAQRKDLKRSEKISTAQMRFVDEADENSETQIPLGDALKWGLTDALIRDVLDERGPDPVCLYGGGDIESVAERVIDWVSKYGPDYTPVKVMTIHKSKGSEADVVVLIRDLSKKQARREAEEQETDERRVWYTAVTRCKDQLIITNLDPNEEETRFV